jgi:hypothetical protein
MLDPSWARLLDSNPVDPGDALRKANLGNEKRICLKSGRYAQANQLASLFEAAGPLAIRRE